MKIKIKPIDTAEMLYKALIGFVGMNLNFDDKIGEPNEDILRVRGANYGLIRAGIISNDFIKNNGLENKYNEYMKKVDLEVVKINLRNREGK